ncbi:MAG: hypothetical protein Terrestrivirus10_13 [Terrestrivirus sp.]|uniref:Uncharacterized protein n=1 Tax=Terrestrivirus sp. TaxID=2487775 RepID=A0A3G4ZT58_9VIRU|nr:MAG: hypothetical protein Terrestrivirus10_13 [Terrestrivirus sp.]
MANVYEFKFDDHRYDHLKNRLIDQFFLNHDACHTSLLGGTDGDRIINNFSISSDGKCNIVMYNKKNGSSFDLTMFFAKMNYNMDVTKKNKKIYHGKQKQGDKSVSTTYNVNEKDIMVFGITLGDIVKCFHNFTHESNESNESNKSRDDIVFNVDSERNKQIRNLIKKILTIDTSNGNVKNTIGVLGDGNSSNFSTWSDLEKKGFIEKWDNSIDGFFNRIIYFSINSVNSLLHVVRNTKKNKNKFCTVKINESAFVSFFDSISKIDLATRIMNMYLFGNDYTDQVNSDNGPIILKFDVPKSIPEILKQLIDEENECIDRTIIRAKVNLMYHKLVKTPSNKQKELLETKYKPTVLSNATDIPNFIPYFALRNIYLDHFTLKVNSNDRIGGGGMYTDLDHVIDVFDESIRNLKDQKYKFISNKREATIHTFRQYGCSCFWCRNPRYKPMKDINMANNDEIEDGKYIFEHPNSEDYETEFDSPTVYIDPNEYIPYTEDIDDVDNDVDSDEIKNIEWGSEPIDIISHDMHHYWPASDISNDGEWTGYW